MEYTRRDLFGLAAKAAAATAVGAKLIPTLVASAAETDWQEAIPSLYFAGKAVWGAAVTLPNGTRYQPVVSRILRGGTFFAKFADDRGQYYAISENDGSLWKVRDYYDNTTWDLYAYSDEGQDVTDQTPWIFQAIAWIIVHLVQILYTIGVAIAFLMAVFVIWVFGPGNKGRGGPRSQITERMLQGGGGIGNMWDTEPRYRKELTQFPAVVDTLTRLGEITFNP